MNLYSAAVFRLGDASMRRQTGAFIEASRNRGVFKNALALAGDGDEW